MSTPATTPATHPGADPDPSTQAEPEVLRPKRGPLAALHFAATHGMLRADYARLLLRFTMRRLFTASGRRLHTDGMTFLGPGLQLQIARGSTVSLGRFTWIGHGTKIRCHEGRVEIGAKTVLGQECTISAYRRVAIGEHCVIADRAMFIDFDHNVTDVEQPIRKQGIYKRDVVVGNNVWIGYNAQILRGVTVGDNAIIGANSVVTRDIPANAVAAGTPARVVRMRDAPRTLRWANPIEPGGYGPAGPRWTRPPRAQATPSGPRRRSSGGGSLWPAQLASGGAHSPALPLVTRSRSSVIGHSCESARRPDPSRRNEVHHRQAFCCLSTSRHRNGALREIQHSRALTAAARGRRAVAAAGGYPGPSCQLT